jgi:hypothetical protein
LAITHTFTVEGDLLLVKASGFDGSLEDVQQYGMAIIQACLENGCRRVLTDETDLEYRLSTMDTFDSARTLAEMVPGVHRAAIVVNPRQITNATFWETVAVNRGATIRVFKTFDEARRWIDE